MSITRLPKLLGQSTLFHQGPTSSFAALSFISGFQAAGVIPRNPLTIVKASTSPSSATEGGAPIVLTEEHPLLWVMTKVADGTSVPDALPTALLPREAGSGIVDVSMDIDIGRFNPILPKCYTIVVDVGSRPGCSGEQPRESQNLI